MLFLRSTACFHMLVEEGEDFFRMPSEVVVTILEASGRALDPEQLLLLAAKQIAGLLGVFRISCPRQRVSREPAERESQLVRQWDYEEAELRSCGPNERTHAEACGVRSHNVEATQRDCREHQPRSIREDQEVETAPRLTATLVAEAHSSLQFHVLVIDRRQIRQPRLQQFFRYIVRPHVR